MNDKKSLILIVDDNPVNNMLVQAQLKVRNYDSIVASSGKEALKMIDEHHPDAVLLDFMMPEMDGIEVLKTIRQNPETHTLPVIIVSAMADVEHHLKAELEGANGYLDKPLLSDALIQELKRVLR